MLREAVLVGGVDLVAMAVALGNLPRVIDLGNARAARKHGRIGAKPHGAAEVAGDAAFLQLVAFHPFGHQADDGLARCAEFGRVRLLDAAEVPRRLDDGHLHAETDAEIRYLALAGELRGADFPLGAALAETARHQNAVDMFEEWGGV